MNVKSKKKNWIDDLPYEELVDLQRDLYSGGRKLKRKVSTQIKHLSETEIRSCSTCGNEIDLNIKQEFTLIFGTVDVKKRATFCALDCMEYFTRQLKSLTNGKTTKQRKSH